MAGSVDRIDITNWRQTGLNVQIPQYEFTLELWWTRPDGTKGHSGPTIYRYPNDLASMPVAVRKAFAEEQIMAVARVNLGIDRWEDYQ